MTGHELVTLAMFGVLPGRRLVSSLFFLGLRLLPSGQAALIGTLETPLMPFWVWLAFQEMPSLRALAGGALVMAAVVADIIGDNRTRKQPAVRRPADVKLDVDLAAAARRKIVAKLFGFAIEVVQPSAANSMMVLAMPPSPYGSPEPGCQGLPTASATERG